MLVLLATALAVVVAAGIAAAYVQAREAAATAADRQALAVARSVAELPEVVAAATDPALTPAARTAALQPLAEEVRARTGTSFVVVMGTDGTRWTHPDTRQIGRTFVGHTEEAVAGRDFSETYTGTLGESVRAVVPVRDGRDDGAGDVVALVSVGIPTAAVGAEVARQVPVLLGAGLVALAACVVVAGLLARRLRRQTHGLGPAELSRMYEFHDAMLHAVREGLVLLDPAGRIQLLNDEARRLLALGDDAVGRPVGEVGLPAGLGSALADGGRRTDEVHLAGDRVVVVSQAPARWEGRLLGSVVTLRDHTDLLTLSGELDSVRSMAESLRSQAHEAANRLHAVVSLIEIGEPQRAVDLATAELERAQVLTDQVVAAVGEPVVAAFLLGKSTQASERGVELRLPDDLEVPEGAVDAGDLVTILGNLVDNAIDAAAAEPAPRWVEVRAGVVDGTLRIAVADSGPGIPPAVVEQAFARGWTTKEASASSSGRGLGLALVRAAARRHGGSVEVGDHPEGGAVLTVSLPLVGAATRVAP